MTTALSKPYVTRAARESPAPQWRENEGETGAQDAGKCKAGILVERHPYGGAGPTGLPRRARFKARPIRGYIRFAAGVRADRVDVVSGTSKGTIGTTMPFLPSLHSSETTARPWSIGRAAAYGAFIGALAALFKAWAPLRFAAEIGGRDLSAVAVEVAGAAIGFALLCAAAAALRNFLTRQLV